MPMLAAAAATACAACAAAAHDASLPVLLQVDWTLLPDIPAQGPEHQGFQDSDDVDRRRHRGDGVRLLGGWRAGVPQHFLPPQRHRRTAAVGAAAHGAAAAAHGKDGLLVRVPRQEVPIR